MKKKYKIDQSPLYKLHSHNKLADVLSISDVKILKRIANRGDVNYLFFETDAGRKIECPKMQLSRIHKRINNLLTRIQCGSYLNSGVKGKSNITNAAQHLNNSRLLKVDIAKYYQSITEKQVQTCFVQLFKCSKDVAETLSKIICVKGHLPTGSTISLSMSYFVNKPVFDHIERYCKQRNVTFTCYVDDLTFSGDNVNDAFKNYITGYIKQARNYKCHKIRMHKPETSKCVTGAVIENGQLLVKNKHRKAIHSLLNGLDNMIKTNHTESPELIRYFQVLQGHLFSAGQINHGYKLKGKEIVSRRKELQVKALNQNTM